MTRVINLTAHEIVVDTQGFTFTFEPSGQLAKIHTDIQPMRHMEVDGCQIFEFGFKGIPLSLSKMVDFELPDPEEGTLYLVPTYVAKELQGERRDLICPDMANANRDGNGRVISVPGFIQFDSGDNEDIGGEMVSVN